jgi:hypothetical protein
LLGTIVNAAAIIAGALLGNLLRGGFPEKYKSVIMQGVSLTVILIGLSMALKTQNILVLTLSIVTGGILGEALRIEERLDSFGRKLEGRFGGADLFMTVPKEAKLISVEVVDGVAYVNFNKEFQTKHWGGSAGEAMTLYSITNSLVKLPDIDKVQFLLEGKKQESILGHADTTEPISPNWTMVKE